ncbi:MAG: sugar ABC transporter substrate-binding protein [Anaerolineales bacterium]|uniref:ABC transporter substrate-binding protein n=1 Tax=Candidatus Villigracilis proximus TaxID=3140683 RepID=UPI003134D789|nr:sugar ABC transporter substrate-binding protein [Anaerolineales bacterium]
MNKKFLFVLSLLVMLSLMLSACGGGATSAPAADEKIELRVWGHQAPAFNAADQAMLDEFMKQNPNVTIKYETFPWDVFIQTIQTSLPAGNTADVILIPGGYTCRYAAGGQLLEVPADVMTLDAAKEMFYAAPLGGQTCDGKMYGFPAEYNIEYGGAYVNPALFEAAGVAYPPKWENWDAVIADAEKMTTLGSDNVMTVAGLHYTNSDQLFTYFLAGILEQNADYFAEDGKHFNFNSPEAVATIQKLMDMAQTNKVVDPIIFNADSEWVGESFAQGHNGIGILGSWYAGDAKLAYPDLKFDYVTLPPMMGSDYKFASVGGWGYVVGKSTAHPEIAWKLAAFMGADQANVLAFNSTSGTVPAMKAVAADPKLLESAPFIAATLPLLDFGQYQGNLTDPDQLAYEIVYPTILDAIQGNLTAEEAANSIHEAANAMVDAAQ